MAQVRDARVGEDLLELAPEPALHLVLVEEDPVLGEPAGLDVAVEEQDSAARGRQRPRREKTRGACPHDSDHVSEFIHHTAKSSTRAGRL
jgi:hypothetical protein